MRAISDRATTAVNRSTCSYFLSFRDLVKMVIVYQWLIDESSPLDDGWRNASQLIATALTPA